MKILIRYLKLWLLFSKNSFLTLVLDKFSFFIFLLGKVIRFSMYIAFLYFLVNGAESLAGFTTNQTIFFFLTFNVIDVLSQFLFREVYHFRPLVVSGRFDLVLLKPASALFRVLLGGADIIDLVTLPPLLFFTFWIGKQLNPSTYEVFLYIVLLLSGIAISAAFHIMVLAIGIMTLEIDHTIMIYRDLSSMGRLPIDIYKEPLRSVLTFLFPIGIMITFPAKALMGMLSPASLVLSLLLAVLSISFSIQFWKFALKKYSSASS